MITEKSPIMLACEELGKRIRELKSAIENLERKPIVKRRQKEFRAKKLKK